MVDEVKTDQRVHVPDADPRSLENLDIAAAVTGAAGNICETVRERMLLHEADFRARKLAPIEHKKVYYWRLTTFRPDYTAFEKPGYTGVSKDAARRLAQHAYSVFGRKGTGAMQAGHKRAREIVEGSYDGSQTALLALAIDDAKWEVYSPLCRLDWRAVATSLLMSFGNGPTEDELILQAMLIATFSNFCEALVTATLRSMSCTGGLNRSPPGVTYRDAQKLSARDNQISGAMAFTRKLAQNDVAIKRSLESADAATARTIAGATFSAFGRSAMGKDSHAKSGQAVQGTNPRYSNSQNILLQMFIYEVEVVLGKRQAGRLISTFTCKRPDAKTNSGRVPMKMQGGFSVNGETKGQVGAVRSFYTDEYVVRVAEEIRENICEHAAHPRNGGKTTVYFDHELTTHNKQVNKSLHNFIMQAERSGYFVVELKERVNEKELAADAKRRANQAKDGLREAFGERE